MHLKFLGRGTGSAAAAAAYLLAKRDAAGTERASVEVLRGDPLEVARVADQLPFKYRYTSGVIAWSLEDAPTRTEIGRVLDEFEKTAWAGLERDRYIWSAVLHGDHDGGVHVHILAARCDLATGRSLNIAAPGWQKTYDPLRDFFNYECGWSRPDDPARARPYRPSPHLAYLDAETLRAGWEVEPDRRALVGEHLMGLVAAGAVTDRGGVVAALEGLGFEVPRQGRHYVTIRRPETGERLRLKGGLYEADFDRERVIRQVREPSGDRDPADRGDDAKRAAEAWRDLEEKRLKRADYHRARYGGGGRVRAGGARDAVGDVGRGVGPAAVAVGGEAVGESLAEHLQRELGGDAVVVAGDSVADRSRELEVIRVAAAGDATACLAAVERVKELHADGDRAAVSRGLTGVVRAVRAGAEAAGRADRGLAGAGRVLAGAGRTARGCGDALDRAVRDAGPDLTELMRQRQERRAVVVAGREQAVCATSPGSEWLDQVRQEVLGGADRHPTVAERERVVEAVEGRVGTYLAGLEESLAATSAGAALLREEFSDRDAPLSFAARARVLKRVEQRVDEALQTQEETLRAIPPGRRYLSAAAEQVRTAEAAVPPALADRESMVRAATQQVGEEVDRLEEELLAIAVGEDLLAEAAGALAGAGRTRSLGERWEACERVKSGVEEELDRREAAVRADPVGEEFLRDARLEVLGSAEREAATLGERARIVKAAAEAKSQAEMWNEEKAARVEKLRALPGGLDLYHAHLADRDPKWSLAENTPPSRELDEAALAAAESNDTRLKRLRGVLSDESDAARYQEVLDQVAGQFKMSDVDNALAAGEKARAERETQQWEEKRDAVVEELRALPGGMNLYHAHLADLDPKWDRKNRKSSRENIDAALAAAKSDVPRLDRLRDVLSDESDAAHYQEVLDDSPGGFNTATLDRALAAGERAREEREASARRAADLETATEEAKAAAARSNIKLRDAHVRMIYETGETHESGLLAVERTTAALAAAADQQLPKETIISTWNANDSAPGGIAAALTRVSRLEQLFSAPGEGEAFIAVLDEQDPSWRTRTHPRTIDRALEIAERKPGRETETPWNALVLNAEQQFPGASSVTWRRAAAGFTGATDTDRHARSVSQTLSDRARARSHAAAAPEPPPSCAEQRVIDWLRSQVELQQLAAARLRQRNRNSVQPVAEKSPVRKLARLVPDATREDAEPLLRAVMDLGERTEPARLAQRARNSVQPVAEKSPVRKLARLVPDATREDAEREQEERRQTEAAQRRRQNRLSRVEQALSDPAAAEAFVAALDAQHSSWRTGASPADIDQALDVAEGKRRGGPPSWQHRMALETERMIPGAPSTAWRSAGGRFDRTTEAGREGWRVSQTLSDRALSRAFAAEKPEPPAPRNLAGRLFNWLRTQLEKLFRLSRPAAPACAEASTASFAERYSQQWPEHAEDIHRPDFEELAAGASARNKLFERQEFYSSPRTTADPGELPAALAKPAPAWTDEVVQKVTWQATPGVGPERTMSRQIVDAHLDDYENGLPEQYAHSAEWRAIRERAEEAVRKLLQDGWRYKRAARKGDDRKKRKLEADAINGACGRDARRLHREMMAARAAARPDWEVTVRIRAVRDAIRRDDRIKLKQEQQPQERPDHKQPEREPTRDHKPSRAR